jgi:hypothetical protein
MFSSLGNVPYVPETIVPVIGIASWSRVLVDTRSLGLMSLNVLAIV